MVVSGREPEVPSSSPHWAGDSAHGRGHVPSCRAGGLSLGQRRGSGRPGAVTYPEEGTGQRREGFVADLALAQRAGQSEPCRVPKAASHSRVPAPDVCPAGSWRGHFAASQKLMPTVLSLIQPFARSGRGRTVGPLLTSLPQPLGIWLLLSKHLVTSGNRKETASVAQACGWQAGSPAAAAGDAHLTGSSPCFLTAVDVV